MDDEDHFDAEATLSALADQLDCYRHVGELTVEQSRHVRTGETEKLLVVLERRQGYMDTIAELEQTLAPLKRSWPTPASAWTASQRGRAESLFGEAKRLLEEITTRDAQDMQTMQLGRQGVGRQLRQTETDGRVVRQINRRYATAAYGGGGANGTHADARR